MIRPPSSNLTRETFADQLRENGVISGDIEQATSEGISTEIVPRDQTEVLLRSDWPKLTSRLERIMSDQAISRFSLIGLRDFSDILLAHLLLSAHVGRSIPSHSNCHQSVWPRHELNCFMKFLTWASTHVPRLWEEELYASAAVATRSGERSRRPQVAEGAFPIRGSKPRCFPGIVKRAIYKILAVAPFTFQVLYRLP